jgi:hypothetical protein
MKHLPITLVSLVAAILVVLAILSGTVGAGTGDDPEAVVFDRSSIGDCSVSGWEEAPATVTDGSNGNKMVDFEACRDWTPESNFSDWLAEGNIRVEYEADEADADECWFYTFSNVRKIYVRTYIDGTPAPGTEIDGEGNGDRSHSCQTGIYDGANIVVKVLECPDSVTHYNGDGTVAIGDIGDAVDHFGEVKPNWGPHILADFNEDGSGTSADIGIAAIWFGISCVFP